MAEAHDRDPLRGVGPRGLPVACAVIAVGVVLSLLAVSMGTSRDGTARAGEVPTVIDALRPSVVPAYDGRWVTVRPPLGSYAAPLRVYVTRQEFEMARRLEALTARPVTSPFPTAAEVRWWIEPSAVLSPTLVRQHRVWNALQWMVERYAQVRESWHVDLIVGRSQHYIRDALERIGCRPDLSSFDGVVPMGATVCNRTVIILNLTGFLFLRRSSQSLTAEMEARPEPSLRSQPYLIVERNNLALAHEWVHVLRSAIIGSVIREGDPIWFREGYAHVMSLIARSKASRMQIDYVNAHVISLRYDPRQLAYCPGSLARYRTSESMVHGCSYTLGALAMEYLFSYYGGIARLMTMFRLTNDGVTFSDAFAHVYGISLAEFERRADGFIRNVRKAAQK